MHWDPSSDEMIWKLFLFFHHQHSSRSGCVNFAATAAVFDRLLHARSYHQISSSEGECESERHKVNSLIMWQK